MMLTEKINQLDRAMERYFKAGNPVPNADWNLINAAQQVIWAHRIDHPYAVDGRMSLPPAERISGSVFRAAVAVPSPFSSLLGEGI